MGYDVLEEVINLTDENSAVSRRLKKVARLIASRFGCDDCAIYRLEARAKELTLAAFSGRRSAFRETYEHGEGVAWKAVSSKKQVSAAAKSSNGKKGGLSVLAVPLTDDIYVYGALYIKSSKARTGLKTEDKKLLTVIARQIAYMLKCDLTLTKLKRLYDERRELNLRLSQAEKLMTIGELSATLAHEIKTPLVNIGGFSARLDKKIEQGSPLRKYVEHITTSVKRLEGIIDDILAFTEEKGLKFEPMDVNDAATAAAALFTGAMAKCSIGLEMNLSQNPVTVMADPNQLKIAFDNLIANAVQSMSDKGGRLYITTRNENNWGVFEITDSGGGIDPLKMSNIFNPFFTTKESGTGLGLTITEKIVTRHRGKIEVRNDFGTGMTFTIKIQKAPKGKLTKN
ncbi:MAG: ATP-binding protein [Deltaproteobacteria bacterium]|nr:ATP-binding protein [Deltaproteobacteria bacterium]